MSQVEDIRRALRISNNSLDDEIRDTIDAAVLDLRTAGAGRGDVDALTSMAVKLYARWQFDYRGKGEQYRQAYESLKAVLSLCPEYREGDGDG
ncbi:head-tail connector protein [uncultured Flavonifractor sp.]|uniref:head-tail connector protein n=1 Tax=uncultured Flavonifractor sp. TaxID=1193534 RepID=UPI00260C847B|nr:head-tail connector protein [uncultured Flavonifractor sp.]